MIGFRQNCWDIMDKSIKIRAILVNEAWMLYDRFNMCFTPLHFRMFRQYMFIPSILRTNYCYSFSIFTFQYIHTISNLSIGRSTYKVLGLAFNCAHYISVYSNRQMNIFMESA